MKAVLSRAYEKDVTTGKLIIFNGSDVIFECVTLELPWKLNKKYVSCIPEGNYKVMKVFSAKFNDCFYLRDVPDRTGVLIHAGNFTRDTEGCILVGKAFKDIDKDGIIDITESKVTLTEMLAKTEETFELIII